MRELDAGEIDALLRRNGLAVLAFDGGTYPYPIPVGFGYDTGQERLVVQLEGGPDSDKKKRLEHDPNVGLTVYEEVEPGTCWQSVVLRGELVEISYQEAESAFAALALNTQGAPNPVLWNGLSGSSNVTPYELRIHERSGREFTTD